MASHYSTGFIGGLCSSDRHKEVVPGPILPLEAVPITNDVYVVEDDNDDTIEYDADEDYVPPSPIPYAEGTVTNPIIIEEGMRCFDSRDVHYFRDSGFDDSDPIVID